MSEEGEKPKRVPGYPSLRHEWRFGQGGFSREEISDLLPEEVRSQLKELLRNSTIKTVKVEGGRWNELDEDMQRRTGLRGVYVVPRYHRTEEGTVVELTLYQVDPTGNVRIVVDSYIRRGNLIETLRFEEISTPNTLRFGANIIKDEKKPDEVSLTFFELIPHSKEQNQSPEPSPTPPPSE